MKSKSKAAAGGRANALRAFFAEVAYQLPRSQELHGLQRVMRAVFLLAGIVISIALLIISGLVVHGVFKDELDDIVKNFSLVNKALDNDMANYNINNFYLAEKYQQAWEKREHAPAPMVRQFLANKGYLELHQHGDPFLTFALGDPTALSTDTLSHYLELSRQVARQLAQETFQFQIIGINYTFPAKGAYLLIDFNRKIELPQAVGAPVAPLLARLTQGLPDFQSEHMAAYIRQHPKKPWIDIFVDPLIGRPAIRLTKVVQAHGRPVIFWVKSLDIKILQQLSPYLGKYSAELFIDNRGKLIYGSLDASPAIAAFARQAAQTQSKEAVSVSYHAGNIFIVEHLPFLGWSHVQVVSWKSFAHSSWRLAALTVALLALALLFLWLSLWLLERQLIAPAFSRSQRTLESEDLNRTMVRTAPAGLALYAIEDARIILQNRVMDDWERQSKHGATFQSLLRAQPISPGEYGNDALDRLIQLELDDGATLDLHVHAVHSKYLGVAVLLCHVVDVTAIKTTERKLDEARKKAEEANRAKSQFLAVMSHEIRTPLNAVLSSLELLARSPLAAAQRQRLRVAENSSQALREIVNDILDLSKVEAGQMTLERIPFNLRTLSQEVAQGMAPLAQAKGLAFTAVIDEDLAPAYLGDPARIRQIMFNLLSNAIKFTDSGEVIFEVYPQQEEAADSPIVIGVIDSGIGIAEEDQGKIFAEFTQADTSISRRFGGTGLGLSLCKKLSELMQGSLEFSSELGLGSAFSVTLPLPACEQVAQAVAAPRAAEPPAGGERHGRILVVDDYQVNGELIRDQLIELGYDADVANSGADALRLAGQRRYQLIATDLNMPGMDGYALARALREHAVAAPIIAITAHAGEEESRNCAEVGISGILLKPVSLAMLDQAMRAHLPAARPPAEASDSGARPALTAERLQLLLDSLESSLHSLDAAAQARDERGMQDQLHAIKGVFAMLRIDPVVQMCQTLEDFARTGAADAVAQQLSGLRQLAHRQLREQGLWRQA
ncbi:ATP-binding protein [Chromobacterium aquaticum]|uniref:histidine kinase n=3 Tax=Chromobacterium aquaticum TaxID=467180 RepID=A0ABV8ZWD5_9NEIS